MIFWIILTIGFILALSVAHFKLGPLTVAIMVTLLVAFAVDRTRFLEIFIIHLSVIQWTLVSLGYAFLGLTWSFIEWRSHVRRIFNRLDISKYSKDEVLDKLPRVEENKERISSWIIYWPFCFMRWILEDAITWITKGMIRAFSGIYKKITNSVIQ